MKFIALTALIATTQAAMPTTENCLTTATNCKTAALGVCCKIVEVGTPANVYEYCVEEIKIKAFWGLIDVSFPNDAAGDTAFPNGDMFDAAGTTTKYQITECVEQMDSDGASSLAIAGTVAIAALYLA